MLISKSFQKLLYATVFATSCSACVTQGLPPLVQDAAFEPISPLMPVAQVSVTGSIFNDNSASSRFGYKKNYQVGDIITVVLTESALSLGLGRFSKHHCADIVHLVVLLLSKSTTCAIVLEA